MGFLAIFRYRDKNILKKHQHNNCVNSEVICHFRFSSNKCTICLHDFHLFSSYVFSLYFPYPFSRILWNLTYCLQIAKRPDVLNGQKTLSEHISTSKRPLFFFPSKAFKLGTQLKGFRFLHLLLLSPI